MTQRIYILPVVHLTAQSYNVPKYLPHRLNPPITGLEGVRWSWVTYLLENMGILVADVTDAQHTLLAGQADVLVVPGLDNTIPNTAARNTVRSILETANIPGGWVNTGMTYRSVLRVVLGLFQYHNRLTAIIQRRVFDGSLNLDMTVAQIPAAVRDRLRQAATDLELDYSWVTSATTIRQLLKGMGDQFASRSFEIGGITI